jgi:hypothetical protein
MWESLCKIKFIINQNVFYKFSFKFSILPTRENSISLKEKEKGDGIALQINLVYVPL